MRLRAAILLLLSAAVSNSASAEEKVPISLVKTADWTIHAGSEACSLEANFGSGKQAVLAILTRYQPGPSFDLTLAGDAVKSSQPRLRMQFAFADIRKPLDWSGTAGKLGDGRPVVILNGLAFMVPDAPAADGGEDANSIRMRYAANSEVSGILFRPGEGKWYRLETGPMTAPLALMHECTQALVRSWGYDPLIQGTLSKPASPKGIPGNWIKPGDFPNSALRQGHNGLVNFRLDVDASGTVTACHVLRRTSPDDFGNLTCNLIVQRAQMSPALDAKGNPVKSYFINSVRWSAGS